MINKKTKNLTKIFLRDYIGKFNILNEKNKINKKSTFVWSFVILSFFLIYISVYLISELKNGKEPEIFLKVYLPIIGILMLFQLIIMVCNVFFYSKDLEYILPLPVKSIDILISKLFTVIIIMYMMEAVFLIIPLFFYGILVAGTIKYFLYSLFVLLIFPVLYTIIIGILTIIIMRILKKVKNKNIVQIIIVGLLTMILLIGLFWGIIDNLNDINNSENANEIKNNLDIINNHLIIINPIIKILTEKNILIEIINIIKIIIINLVAFIVFIFLGKKLYYNKLLINSTKKRLTKKIKNKYKKRKTWKSYLDTEIKKITNNTTYLTQNISNYINIVIIALIIIYIMKPIFIEQLQKIGYIENTSMNQIKIEIFCLILGIIQIISTFNSLAITSISKEGKEAVFIKYIPISLYNQFLIRTIPYIILNEIMIILVLYVIAIKVSFWYYILALITSLIINIINSYITLLIDCKNPNLNWTNIESITKNSSNKIYQYIITIAFVLILIYFTKIFRSINFILSAIIINIFFILILILINIYINKNINKIFNKIF